jgi:hypothetical protein
MGTMMAVRAHVRGGPEQPHQRYLHARAARLEDTS